jgi:hypothetical protein
MAKKDSKSIKAWRQGELLFVRLNEQDMGLLGLDHKHSSQPQWQKLRTRVLREGELTGHRHEVLARTRATASILAPGDPFTGGLPDMDMIGHEDRLLLANEPVEVAHPEHRALRLPKGVYLVIVQREYDETRTRRVLD